MNGTRAVRDILALGVLAVCGAALRGVLIRIRPADQLPAVEPEPRRAPRLSVAGQPGGRASTPPVGVRPPEGLDALETDAVLELEPAGEEFHLPAPTIWPVVLAAGITLAAFGITTSPIFSVFGLVLFVVSVAGWVAEVRHG